MPCTPGHQHGDRHQAGHHHGAELVRDQAEPRQDVAEHQHDQDRLGERPQQQQGRVAHGHVQVAPQQGEERRHSRSSFPVRWM